MVSDGRDNVDSPYDLAINLADLDRLEPEHKAHLLKDKLSPKLIVVDMNDPKEVALAFKCGLLSAAMVCDIIRIQDWKAGDYPTRVYIRRDRSNPNAMWSKIPDKVPLAVKCNGTWVLNRAVFRQAVMGKVAVIQPSVLPGRLPPTPTRSNPAVASGGDG
jgi:hypothetical protein